MKHTFSLLCCALAVCSTGGMAQTINKMNLEHATVFLSGALMESSATINLKQGENEVTLTNIANAVNSQSIIINATNGVAVASSSYQNSGSPVATTSPLINKMLDTLESLYEKRGPVVNKISSIDDQLKLLQTDITENGDDKPNPGADELTKMIELINRKKEALLNEKDKQSKILGKITQRITYLNNRMTEEQGKIGQQGGQLQVKFYAREAGQSKITVKYITPNAGWSPAYDIWADDVNSPIKLYYNANIHQNCGINWEKVRLTLSTGNPQEGMQPPSINSWYMSLSAPPPPPVAPVTANKKALVNNNQQWNTTTSSMSISQQELSTLPTTSSEDIVSITPGLYQNSRGALIEAAGARAQQQQMASMTNYVAVDNSGVNTTFDIELPYSIPNDGQQHYVAVKEYNVPASYKYFSIPKMDKDAFLQADITRWNDLNLLPGPTNIFYEGTYIGQGNIDPRTIQDTMQLSLGRDKKIVIKREQDKKMHTIKKSGTTEEETYAYNITVRNNRNEPVTILVEDQLPVSNDKDLQITDVNLNGGDLDPATGTITWTTSFKANETKKITFGYTIKHPKDRQLIGMR